MRPRLPHKKPANPPPSGKDAVLPPGSCALAKPARLAASASEPSCARAKRGRPTREASPQYAEKLVMRLFVLCICLLAVTGCSGSSPTHPTTPH